MKQLKKTILTLVALIAISTGAWADEGTLLTTITPDGNGNPVYTVADVATLDKGGADYSSDWGWNKGGEAWLTITPAANVTITKVKFTTNAGDSWEDTEAPFRARLEGLWVFDDKGNNMDNGEGVTKIEVYGAAASSGSAVEVDWNKAEKTGTFKMPGGNVTLQVEYYPAMLTLAASPADGGSIAVDGLSLGGPKAFDVPAAWSDDETTLSANDLPTDFAAIDDADLPATIAALSSDEVAFMIYGFDGEKTKVVSYVNGTKDDTDAGFVKRYSVSSWIEGGMKIYYTTAPTLPAGFDTDGTNIYVEPKTQFQVKAVPAEGYHLVSLSDGTNTYDVDADGIATVTMPEGDADLTLTATFAETTYAVTFADDLAEPDKWTADPAANVTKGETVTVTYTGSKKVIGVKAEVKKRPEFVPSATIQNLESFVEVENNKDGTITLHMPTLNPSTYNVTNSSYLSNGAHTLHFGYEIGSGTDMSAIGTDFNTRQGWSDHTPFSELDKTIDITSGKPRVAILITGHLQSATCPAPDKEHYWGLYRYTNPVKVTYNLGGGSVSGSTADKVEYLFSGDALATTFAAPTREGFTFDGWYTSAEGGTKLTASNATSATTIYAHWNAIAE